MKPETKKKSKALFSLAALFVLVLLIVFKCKCQQWWACRHLGNRLTLQSERHDMNLASLLACFGDLLALEVLCDSKLSIFGLWTVALTKQATRWAFFYI